jgi:hypothetical protein
MGEKLLPSSIATLEIAMEKAPFVTFYPRKYYYLLLRCIRNNIVTPPSAAYAISPFYPENILMPSSTAPYHHKNILASSFAACTIVFF